MARKPVHKVAMLPPVDVEGCLVLRGELFWKWRALDADLKRTTAEAASKQTAIDAEIAKHDVLRGLIGEKHALVREHAQHQLEMNTVHIEMTKVLGVDIKHVSIDDKTGRVHVLDENQNPVPIKPKKAKRSKAVKR